MAASCWAEPDLGDDGPGLRVQARPLEDDPPVEPGEVLGVGQPHVDDGEPARTRGGRPACWKAARWAARVARTSSELSAMNARPNVSGLGQAQVDEVGLDERQPVDDARGGRAAAGALEHRRVEIDAGDLVAGLGQRDGQPPAADRQLEDRPTGAVGQGQVQVEVARVVGQVQVVEAGQRRRPWPGRGGRTTSRWRQPSQRHGVGRPACGRRGR